MSGNLLKKENHNAKRYAHIQRKGFGPKFKIDK